MLISNEYRAQLAQLHREKEDFGTSAVMYAPIVRDLIAKHQPKSFVDYGAGKQALRPYVQGSFGSCAYIPYDPAIPEIAEPPGPADMVMTADVLEHLEPECLDAVMDDLKRLTKKIGFHVVHTGPALNVLPDGRNAHIIQEPPEWWLFHFMSRFDILRFDRMQNGFMILVRAK